MDEDSIKKDKLKKDDKLHVAEQIGRLIEFSPYDSKHVRAMKVARRSFLKHADAYNALAK